MEQILAKTQAELEQEGWVFQSETLPNPAEVYPYKIRLATNLRETPEDPTAYDSVRIPVLLHIVGDAPVTEGLTIRICHKGRGKRRPLKNPLDRAEGRRTIKVSGGWRIPSSKATPFEYTYPKLHTPLLVFDRYSLWADTEELIYRMRLVPVEGRDNVYRAQAAFAGGSRQDIAWIDLLCGYCRLRYSDDDVPQVIAKCGSYTCIAAAKEESIWVARRAHLKDIGFALFDGEKQISEILPVTINLTTRNGDALSIPIVSGK